MSYYEFIIKIADPFRDTLIQRLTDAGCLGVIEQDETITAYFPETVDIGTITNDLSLLKRFSIDPIRSKIFPLAIR